jgi:hypothetical protein
MRNDNDNNKKNIRLFLFLVNMQQQQEPSLAPVVTVPLERIVVGSTTGSQIGALMAAKHLGLKIGGFVHQTSEKASTYGLDSQYAQETFDETRRAMVDKKNVDQCDALLAFRMAGEACFNSGTPKLINYALTGNYADLPERLATPHGMVECPSGRKPVIVLWEITEDSVPYLALQLRQFLLEKQVRSLAVCGPYHSTSAPCLAAYVRDVIIVAATVEKPWLNHQEFMAAYPPTKSEQVPTPSAYRPLHAYPCR